MKEIAVQFSITNSPLLAETKPTMSRRRKNSITATPQNLFNHSQRSHQMQYTAVLPIISLSSVSNAKEKIVRPSENNNSIKQTTRSAPVLTEFRLKAFPSTDMSHIKSRITTSNRLTPSNIRKSSLSCPNILSRSATAHRSNHHAKQQQSSPPPPPHQGARFLYLVNPSVSAQRLTSARLNHQNNLACIPLHQQPQLLTSSILPRPHPQYSHFLAYLRRQSLARRRRKQQEQEAGCSDGVETTIIFNSTRPTPSLSFSTSNLSLCPPSSDISTIPPLLLHSKRKHRSVPSFRSLQHVSSSLPMSYRLKLNQTPLLKQPPPSPRMPSAKPSGNQPILLPQTSVLITPANSVVDETIMFPTKKPPYELQLSGDMLNYCYVSDSGVKYQGQLLPSPV